MPNLVPIRRALISVSDKTGLIRLAEGLHRLGVEMVSTGGTARALADAGLAVVKAEDLTGFQELMGGRVKTLHPAIHGAVLARRDVDGDLEALQDRGLRPIDLVCVNLYPFEQTIRTKDATPDEALEQIDIGGPALIRSAAKNHRFVTVVTSPGQYDELLGELDSHAGATSLALRRRFAAAAFRRTAEYDAAITGWMDATAPPSILQLIYARPRPLRYGENPHQTAALYLEPGGEGPSVATARVLHGKPLSYNNIQDAAAALELVGDLNAVDPDRAGAAIIKHTNACGAGVGQTVADAFELAYGGDPSAAYGGILAVSRRLDKAAADRICDSAKFLEVIVAPDFDDGGLETLKSCWRNVRLLAVGELRRTDDGRPCYRSISGGMLVQQRDTAVADPRQWRHASGPAPTGPQLADAAFVWTVVKHLKSNAVAVARNGQLLGAGCGQVDRVTACRLAVEKAAGRIGGGRAAVAASEAFFPFPDGPQLLIDAGVGCIVQPGGSKRDQEILDLCRKHDVTCLLTGIRHFRH